MTHLLMSTLRRHRSRLLFALLSIAVAAIYLGWNSRVEQSQDNPIRAAASRYGVDSALVKAVVWRESRFNPSVRGRAQELGLMQIREEAAQEWADAEHIDNFEHVHCLDPRTNTLAGTWYLRKLLKRYTQTDNPVPYALADYNAGRGNVLKWNTGEAATNSAVFIEHIGFPGTKDYVKSVMHRYDRYRPVFAVK
jgi:soluble lytic murein transglycosylase